MDEHEICIGRHDLAVTLVTPVCYGPPWSFLVLPSGISFSDNKRWISTAMPYAHVEVALFFLLL